MNTVQLYLQQAPMRFAGKRPPVTPPRITVWNPPIYDLRIFAPDKEKGTESGRLATELFSTYNARVPVVKAAADDLCRKLARKKDVPKATLYPCPNPKAVNDITIEIPLGPGKTDAKRKAAAEPEKARMLAVLKTVRGVYASDDGTLLVYLHQKKPYALHIITQLTEDETRQLETFA